MDNATTQARKPLSRSQLKNREAMEGLIKGIAIFIIIGVATFAEVAFLSLIGKMFPDNVIFKAGAILGAVATGASAVTLLFAKLKWIRAGHQHWISWAFLIAELTIMLLNLIISFKLAGGLAPTQLDSYLYSYYQIMPATPLVALIGWTFIFMTDRQKEMDDARRDMGDELEESEMEHTREQHQVMMSLRRDITHIHANQVRAEVERRIPDIERITQEIVANEIGSMIGMYIPRSVGDRVVDSTAQPIQLAQTGTAALPPATNQQPAPTEKKSILGKFKDWYNRPSGDDLEPQTTAQPTESEVKTTQARQPRPFHSGQSSNGGAAAAGTAAAEDQMRATNPAAYERYIKQQRTAARRARKARQRAGN